jgi:hypothetical protein
MSEQNIDQYVSSLMSRMKDQEKQKLEVVVWRGKSDDQGRLASVGVYTLNPNRKCQAKITIPQSDTDGDYLVMGKEVGEKVSEQLRSEGFEVSLKMDYE